jgi:hypothetical protein
MAMEAEDMSENGSRRSEKTVGNNNNKDRRNTM